MPWVVGIDEAGYGPNLGPLVQAAVAAALPDDEPTGWGHLRGHIRRADDTPDDRILIDDSKRVHDGPNGLAKLERGLAAVLRIPPGPFAEWVRSVGLPGTADELIAEPWFDPAEAIPLYPSPPVGSPAVVDANIVSVNLVCPSAFNRAVAGSGTKATVVAVGLARLLLTADRVLPAGEPLLCFCDKLGGRNFYGPLLASAFPDGWVIAECESAAESRYRIEGIGREVRVSFRPRADAASVPVALASMLAKYAREVCMGQFNRFWATQVPGLRPTAGYPVDARRFLADIRPAMDRLGIAHEDIWRVK